MTPSSKHTPFIALAALFAGVVTIMIACTVLWSIPLQQAHLRKSQVGTETPTPPQTRSVPLGYSNEQFEIVERTGNSCLNDENCILPMEYAMRSSCPYVSLCIKGQCAIVCPTYINR